MVEFRKIKTCGIENGSKNDDNEAYDESCDGTSVVSRDGIVR